MLNIRNEEKNLKRYLKNKISLNENTIVKILITGTLAFTLTACGGGGGSSSQGTIGAPGIESPDEKPEEDIKTETIDKKNEGYQVVGKDIKIEGTITGDSSVKSLVGITAKNSNVESYAEINLAGEEAIGISGTTDGKRAIYTIKNNGKISLSGKNSIGMYAKNGVIAENNGTITGSGEGKYQHKNDGTVIEDSFGTIGIGVINGSKGINNKDIIMDGAYTTGMYAENNSTIENNGNISLTSKIVVENEIEGEVYSSERGMRANSNSIAINNGTITGSGQITGIDARESSQGTNNGNIELESEIIASSGENFKTLVSKVRGMRGRDEGTTVTNDKIIKLAGKAVGIEVDRKASGINNGSISLISKNEENYGWTEVVGMSADNSKITNNGIIDILNGGIGMQGVNNSSIINNGKINIDGENSIGMYAGSNSTAINAEEGVINVGSLAQAGMVADGESALIINKGTINLAQRDGLTEETKESIALQSINGGKIENNGTINIDGDLNLTTGKNSSYVIGTTKDGEYGKISVKTAKLDGNIVVSTQITKSGFKNEYTLQNVVDAEDITLGDNFKFNSDSLLYDATAKTDTWGNLDATLTRNDKTLADYSTDETKENAEVFGKYYTEESYKKLSSDAQSVISAIDTSSKENLNKDLGELKPTIYSNISRQILDTNKFFKEQEKEVINTLGENEYNFAFIGDYKDVDSKGLIEGYTSKASGFIGAINLGNDIFGTIGYSYNDIDYKDNSNGNIQTIHLGLNKMLTYEKFDISLGLNGEYNFNEYNREIEFLNRNAKSDFNSYAVGFTSEISRVFGKESYLKPYLGLDVTYLNYESFKEKNANSLNVAMDSQDYVSVLPKVGIGIGNKFNNLRTFANVEYSYELGNMNKSQTYMFEGFEGKAKLENDNLENTLVTTKVGASYEMNTLSLTGTVGKEFGKRDDTFVTVSLGYKF
jgi:hypothetical protein